MGELVYKPAQQCIYNVQPFTRMDKLNMMHDRCIARMKQCLAEDNQIKFWALAGVDTRILQAKVKMIS